MGFMDREFSLRSYGGHVEVILTMGAHLDQQAIFSAVAYVAGALVRVLTPEFSMSNVRSDARSIV